MHTIIPLILLAAVTLLARAVRQFGVPYVRDWPAAMRARLAVMFLFTAAACRAMIHGWAKRRVCAEF